MAETKKILRVTVEDLEGVELTQTFEVPAGEYVILTTEPCYIAYTQIYGGGKTVQLTIKDRVPRSCGAVPFGQAPRPGKCGVRDEGDITWF